MDEGWIYTDGSHSSQMFYASTKARCLHDFIRYLLGIGYEVCGMLKMAAGNGESIKLKEQYTIIGGGGYFKEYFDGIKARYLGCKSRFYDEPEFLCLEKLDDKVILGWAQEYDMGVGEEYNRYVWVRGMIREGYARELTTQGFMFRAHEIQTHKAYSIPELPNRANPTQCSAAQKQNDRGGSMSFLMTESYRVEVRSSNLIYV